MYIGSMCVQAASPISRPYRTTMVFLRVLHHKTRSNGRRPRVDSLQWPPHSSRCGSGLGRRPRGLVERRLGGNPNRRTTMADQVDDGAAAAWGEDWRGGSDEGRKQNRHAQMNLIELEYSGTGHAWFFKDERSSPTEHLQTSGYPPGVTWSHIVLWRWSLPAVARVSCDILHGWHRASMKLPVYVIRCFVCFALTLGFEQPLVFYYVDSFFGSSPRPI